jgi:hypothetical protein
MAGRGMGAATRGGGAVESGPKNRMLSQPSMKTPKVVLMKKGGEAINEHKLLAMGKKPKKMMGGGMMRGYKYGGSACK